MSNKNILQNFLATSSLSIICLGYLAELPSTKLYLGISCILLIISVWLLYKSFAAKKHGKTGQDTKAIQALPRFITYSNSGAVVLAVLFAWVWAIGWGLIKLADRLPAEWENQNVIVEGYVTDIPRKYTYNNNNSRSDSRYVFNFKVAKIIAAPDTQTPAPDLNLIRVSWYDAEAELRPGQLWRFTLRLRRPYSFMNPGGFDYEAWNIRQGITATAYIRGEAQLLKSSNRMWLDKQRWLVHEIIKNSNTPRAGFISALMLGERSLLGQDENAVIRNTGIAHLLAISGLHLTLVGGGMFWLIFSVLGLFRRLFNLQLGNTLTLAAQLALVFIWLYALWTGFSLPAQRAAIMLSVFMLALITKRFQNPVTIFFLAMTLVLMLDPLAFTSGGFYLSFAALAVVVMSFSYFIPRVKPVKMQALVGVRGRLLNYAFDLLVTQLVLLGGLLPLGLVFFNQFSVIGLLVNLIAIPITSFVIMPWVLFTNLLMFCLPALADVSLAGLGWLLDWLYALLLLADSAPLAVIVIKSPSTLAIVAAILAMPVLIWWVRPYNFALAFIMLLPCLFPVKDKIPPGEFAVHFIDVGQGLAVHLQTASHNLLYDTGASFSSGSNIGDLVLVPYLREIGINKLDILLVSHKDKDHSGGMPGVLDNIPVDKLLLSFDYKQTTPDNPRLTLPCYPGDSWQWDGVKFSMLHPPPKSVGSLARKTNDQSCVLLVESGNSSLLLTGDITKKTERMLLEDYPKMQVDLLQAPHHGSKTSSTSEWLSRIDPQYVVFTSGYRNPFYHPHPSIEARYDELGIEHYTTWRTGTLSFHLSDDSIKKLGAYRLKQQRYWHYRAP